MVKSNEKLQALLIGKKYQLLTLDFLIVFELIVHNKFSKYSND